MVVIEVYLGLFDILQLQVALGQTGVCLLLLEFQRILAVLLLNAVLCLTHQLVLNGLLQTSQVLLLVLHTALELSLQIV